MPGNPKNAQTAFSSYDTDSATVALEEDEMKDITAKRGFRNLEDDHLRVYNRYRDVILDDELDLRFDYEIGDVLGRGRQGIVFHLERRSHAACVTAHALKVFDPSIYHSLDEYQLDMTRIARQVGALQRLFHPNLVQCDCMHEEDGIGMLLMERIEGMDLRALIDSRPRCEDPFSGFTDTDEYRSARTMFPEQGRGLHPGIALYVLRKILRGLELMHRIGYMHCDIKPSNIMIDRFATIKIIDFGRAISIKNARGIILGSPMYMAPELHRRELPTPLSDLYSAGLVLLELLHGDWIAPPGASEEAMLQFKLELPDRLAEFIPSELVDAEVLVPLLKRMLAVNPNERYASVRDADAGIDGIRGLHQHLARESLDVDYLRELETYMQSSLTAERPDLTLRPEESTRTH
jgi:serine/threonine protein kinase